MSGGGSIRPAADGDLPALTELYNHYIRETPITFDLEPFSVEARRAWLAGFATSGRHRLLVAEDEQGVRGFACSRAFRPKAAYDTTVETTIYLAPRAMGARLGTRLYQALFDALRGEPVHLAVGGVTLPNDASVALHRRFGFESVGIFRQVGYKFGRYWDVEWFQKELDGA